MPRISGVFQLPPGSYGVPNTTIKSAPYNTVLDDLVNDANAARPITAGGTGATTAAGAATNLGLGTASAVTHASLAVAAVSPLIVLNKAASGQASSIQGQTAAALRWQADFGDSAAEAGANAGSDFYLRRYSDAGAQLGLALSIVRSTGAATFGGTLSAARFIGVPWELIGYRTGTNVASLAEINLSAYEKIRITGHVYGTSAATAFGIRTSTNNGSSWDAGVSDYSDQNVFGTSGTAAATATTGTLISLSGAGTSDFGISAGTSFTLTMHEFNKAAQMPLEGITNRYLVGGSYAVYSLAGRRVSNTARNGFQLFGVTQNMDYKILIEGVRG